MTEIITHRSVAHTERSTPGETNGCLETRTVAPQAVTTELFVASLAQWVHFVWNRWQ